MDNIESRFKGFPDSLIESIQENRNVQLWFEKHDDFYLIEMPDGHENPRTRECYPNAYRVLSKKDNTNLGVLVLFDRHCAITYPTVQ